MPGYLSHAITGRCSFFSAHIWQRCNIGTVSSTQRQRQRLRHSGSAGRGQVHFLALNPGDLPPAGVGARYPRGRAPTRREDGPAQHTVGNGPCHDLAAVTRLDANS